MVRVRVDYYRHGGASAYFPFVSTMSVGVIVRYNEKTRGIDQVDEIDPDYMEMGYGCIHVYPYCIMDDYEYPDYDEIEHEQEQEEYYEEFMEDVLEWLTPYLPKALQKIINQ